MSVSTVDGLKSDQRELGGEVSDGCVRLPAGLTTRRAAMALLATVPIGFARAAEYPDRPLRMTLGFAPGGATDALARLLAQKLGDRIGQTVVVDNRPGAGTRTAMEAVQNAAPDGYTVGIAAAVTTIFPLLFENAPFAPGSEFVPITNLARAPLFLVVRSDLPAANGKEFLSYGKSSGKLTYGLPGIGTIPHIAGLAMAKAGGFPVTAIPYRGSQPAGIALAAGEIDFGLFEYSIARPLLEQKKIRLLGVLGSQRSSLVPSAPSTKEIGVVGDVNELKSWYMLIAPPATPARIVEMLAARTGEVLGTAEARDRLAALGIEVGTSTPAEALAYFNSQRAQLTRMVQELKLNIRA